MDLDLRQVRFFVAVAEELHFGRAAARLHVSQPALSRLVRRLEDQLGTRLLRRDSRHVVLTARGKQFLDDARDLLAMAQRMQRQAPPNAVRIAHIFELQTSRELADAYVAAYPQGQVFEHAMDSVSQLDALLERRLDVAIIRITPRMLEEHPTGWSHRLLRLEPLVLVGRPWDAVKVSAPLAERPLEVFGDPLESGTYNAFGEYLSAFERENGVSMRWLGTPGAFSHCLALIRRSNNQARSLEFQSYADRYAAEGFPVFQPEEVQPYYPWSLAWRADDRAASTHDFLRIALETAAARRWPLPAPEAVGPLWLPAGEPVWAELATTE